MIDNNRSLEVLMPVAEALMKGFSKYADDNFESNSSVDYENSRRRRR